MTIFGTIANKIDRFSLVCGTAVKSSTAGLEEGSQNSKKERLTTDDNRSSRNISSCFYSSESSSIKYAVDIFIEGCMIHETSLDTRRDGHVIIIHRPAAAQHIANFPTPTFLSPF